MYIFSSFDHLLNCDEHFGAYSTHPEIENAYTNAVWGCVDDYCRDTNDNIKGCGYWSERTQFEFSANRLGASEYFISPDVCTGINSEVNTDMGGPGVSLHISRRVHGKIELTLLFDY